MSRSKICLMFLLLLAFAHLSGAQESPEPDRDAIYEKLRENYEDYAEWDEAWTYNDELLAWCDEGDGLACWYKGINFQSAPGAYKDLGSVDDVRARGAELVERAKPLLLQACENGDYHACRAGRWALLYNGRRYRYIPAYRVDWATMQRLNKVLDESRERLCLVEANPFACMEYLELVKRTPDDAGLLKVHTGLETACQTQDNFSACISLMEADALIPNPKYASYSDFIDFLRTGCPDTDASTEKLVCQLVDSVDAGEEPMGFNPESYSQYRRIEAASLQELQEYCEAGDQDACRKHKDKTNAYSRFNEDEYRQADAGKLEELQTACFESLNFDVDCSFFYDAVVEGKFAPPDPQAAYQHALLTCYQHPQGTADYCSRAARLTLNRKVPTSDPVVEAIPLLARACKSGSKWNCDNALSHLAEDPRFKFDWDGIPDRNSRTGREKVFARAIWYACDQKKIEEVCQTAAIFGIGVVPKDERKAILRRYCDQGQLESCISEIGNYPNGPKTEEKVARGEDLFLIGRLNQISNVLEAACDDGFGNACYEAGKLYRSFLRPDLSRDDLLSFFVAACESGDYRGCLSMGSAMGNGGTCIHYGRYPGNCAREPDLASVFWEESCRYWNGRHTCDSAADYFAGIGNRVQMIAMLNVGCPIDGVADSSACLDLAEAYRDGNGVERDYSTAYDYAERACDKARAEACLLQTDLLVKQQQQVPGVFDFNKKAFKILERACLDLNSEEGCTRALDLARRGYGTDLAISDKLEKFEEKRKLCAENPIFCL